MISLFLAALGRKLIPYAIGAAVTLGGLFMFGYYERGIGYGKCKVEWEQAEKNANAIIHDGVNRANDDVTHGVPDPFDSDKH